MKSVRIHLEDKILSGLVTEQVARLRGLKISHDKDTVPDLVISENRTDMMAPHLLLGGKGEEGDESLSLPLRLGDLNDRVGYLLSGRNRYAADEVISFGHFTLNSLDGLMTDTLTGKNVRLTDKEKLLVLSLYAAPDHARDRVDLLREAFGYSDTAETHTLETHLYRLRQKIEETLGATDLIVTKDGIYTLKV